VLLAMFQWTETHTRIAIWIGVIILIWWVAIFLVNYFREKLEADATGKKSSKMPGYVYGIPIAVGIVTMLVIFVITGHEHRPAPEDVFKPSNRTEYVIPDSKTIKSDAEKIREAAEAEKKAKDVEETKAYRKESDAFTKSIKDQVKKSDGSK